MTVTKQTKHFFFEVTEGAMIKQYKTPTCLVGLQSTHIKFSELEFRVEMLRMLKETLEYTANKTRRM